MSRQSQSRKEWADAATDIVDGATGLALLGIFAIPAFFILNALLFVCWNALFGQDPPGLVMLIVLALSFMGIYSIYEGIVERSQARARERGF